MEHLKIKVIGSGGIGTILLPTLCRVLNFGSPEYDCLIGEKIWDDILDDWN